MGEEALGRLVEAMAEQNAGSAAEHGTQRWNTLRPGPCPRSGGTRPRAWDRRPPAVWAWQRCRGAAGVAALERRQHPVQAGVALVGADGLVVTCLLDVRRPEVRAAARSLAGR